MSSDVNASQDEVVKVSIIDHGKIIVGDLAFWSRCREAGILPIIEWRFLGELGS